MKLPFLNKKTIFILLVLAVAGIGSFVYFRGSISDNSGVTSFDLNQFQSFDDLKGYFQELAREKGAKYAFEVLKTAPVPPNTDMHLLAHAVGDILYEQDGLDGIKICTDDFRNACSHSIVVGLFYDKGEAALPEISEACRKAPGGSGAYTMCFHGLGHGILAALDYDVKKAVEFCGRTSTSAYGYSEGPQCVGGIIMEIVGGGDHDKELWSKKRSEYLKPDDRLYPCNADFVPDQAKYLCYNYLTPHLFEANGGDRNNPKADDFEAGFKICNKLPPQDIGSRDACYGGFGKEFVGLVQSRDIRKDAVSNMTDEQMDQIYQWCKLADNKEGSAACMLHALNSLYWGGENDPKISIRFCSSLEDDYYKGSCFVHLMNIAAYYAKAESFLKSFCSQLPAAYQKDCLNKKIGQ